VKTVWWEDNTVCLIDQTLLPADEVIVRCERWEQVEHAIRSMQVRGAPAIGASAAFGMALAATAASPTRTDVDGALASAFDGLIRSRPTAVNLSWALKRMRGVAAATPGDGAALAKRMVEEAQSIAAEDEAACRTMGAYGAALIEPGSSVLTHCNAGALACVDYGTALGVIRAAFEQGRIAHVFVDETRPFLQGARLTAWELTREDIPMTLITDNMAGHFMQRGQVHCVVVGADRIAANGDVANKIGTYSVAVLAHEHGIPFYVAAPISTVDLAVADGSGIPIEERDPEEVTAWRGTRTAPVGIRAAHPAFDVTPARYVSAIITERGVVRAPYTDGLRRVCSA
jgi:methylthioribose-1-phosphate isomerase